MRLRQRIRASSFNVVGGGGSIPTFGNVVWGPQFGGDNGDIPEVGVDVDMPALALVSSKSVGCQADLDALAMAANQSVGIDVTGEALGAPFWQEVETATTTTTTLTVTKPSGTASGDLLLAFVGATTTGIIVPTVATPAGWTAIRNDGVNGAANSTAGYSFYRIADGTEGASFTFTLTYGAGTVPRATGEVHRVIGTDASPIDAHTGATLLASALDTDPDTPSVTTTVANTLVFSWIVHDHLALNQTHTPPASHDETADFEADNTANIVGSNSAWRVFSAVGATGTAEHNCTETVATDAVMQRIAIAPGTVTIA